MSISRAFCQVIIDFDSTFVSVESLDELSRLVLADAPDRDQRVANIAWITKEGMEGRMGFGESLERRLVQFAPRREQVAALAGQLKGLVNPSVLAHRELIRAHADEVWIVSGGFRELIEPVAAEFGIAPEHVMANEFVWNSAGETTGCNRNQPLAHDGGKVESVRRLDLRGRVVMVGDGMTDYAVRQAGLADVFVAYTETVDRAPVSLRADVIARDFGHVAEIAGWQY